MKDWNSYDNLAVFLARGYPDFLSLAKPLLLDLPPPSPYACERHPFRPIHHDYVSSVYELRFNSGLDAVTKLGLGIAEQGRQSGLQYAAEALNVSDLWPGVDIESRFQGIKMVWLARCPSPLPPPLEFERLLSAADRPGPDPKILLLITSWKDQEAERDVIRQFQGVPNSQDAEDPFAKDFLSEATSFTKHQVAFEDVTEDNVGFLDSEEKWKTWMSRMFAEEDRKRREEWEEEQVAP